VGKIIAIPQLAGLHHCYGRAAANNFRPDQLLANDNIMIHAEPDLYRVLQQLDPCDRGQEPI